MSNLGILACTTTHYQIYYDTAIEFKRVLANNLCQNAEEDFNLMQSWFPGVSIPTTITVQLVSPYDDHLANSAQWCTCPCNDPTFCPPEVSAKNGIYVEIYVDNQTQTSNVRYALTAEVTEMFMLYQDRGWSGANFHPTTGTEGTVGEGLSTFLAQQLVQIQGIQGPNPYFANIWMTSYRPTENLSCLSTLPYSSTPSPSCPTVDYEFQFAPTNSPYLYFTFYLLFLYYLKDQLGYSINQITAAGPSKTGCITEVYQNLTGDKSSDPNKDFLGLINIYYPGTTVLPNNVNSPFPIRWVQQSGNLYYLVSGIPMTGWVYIAPLSFYFDSTGAFSGYVWYNETIYIGKPVNNWSQQIGPYWLWFDSIGIYSYLWYNGNYWQYRGTWYEWNGTTWIQTP